MAVNIRAQCLFPAATNMLADTVSINPCFQNDLAAPGWDSEGLAQDLADALAAYQSDPDDPVEVRLYDLEGSKPVYPMAIAFANKGHQPSGSNQPTETAVCLSFYADHNEPRRRGRVYVPFYKISDKNGLDWKVQGGFLTKVADLAGIFAGLGGVDIDWIVWSERDHAAHKVTNWFVDDAWDTVRSRGYRATTRIVGTTSG